MIEYSPTIEKYVSNYENEDITYNKLYLTEVFEKDDENIFLMNDTALYQDYLEELKTKTIWFSFTEKQFKKYKFNPKLFSYDLYGSTEYWSLLLELNEMHSISEFNRKVIRVFNPDIKSLLTEVLNLEEDLVDYNNQVIYETLVKK